MSMTGKIAQVEVITPPAIRGAARPRFFVSGARGYRHPADRRRAREPADTDFLPPGARIAQRVVFGSDYEEGQRVHSSAPSSACAPQTARQGFKVPRARSEPFPNAAESGREIEFLTVDAGFEPSQKRRVDLTSHALIS